MVDCTLQDMKRIVRAKACAQGRMQSQFAKSCEDFVEFGDISGDNRSTERNTRHSQILEDNKVPGTEIADLLTGKELCRIAKCTRRTLDRWTRLGVFPTPIRIGHGRGSLRWKREDVQQWLDCRSHETVT